MKRVSEPNNSWAVIAAPRTKNRTVEISRSKVRSTNAMHLHYHNFNAFCSINDIVKRLLLFFLLFRRNRRWIHSRRLQRAFLPTTHTHTHTHIYCRSLNTNCKITNLNGATQVCRLIPSFVFESAF